MKQLSGLDSVFLNLETPEAPMHVGAVTVLDLARAPKGFGFATVRARIAERLHLLPSFRRRLVNMPLNLIPPFWIEDPDFRLDRHVRKLRLRRPGTDRELAALVAELIAKPLERTQPLWAFYYVEGLSRRRSACISIIHHACIDGVSGAGLLGKLLDDAAEPPPTAPAADWDPDELPLALDRLVFTARQAWTRQRQFAHLVRNTVPLAWQLGRGLLGARRQAKADGGGDGAAPAANGGFKFAPPRTCFNVHIGAGRAYAFRSLSLTRVKNIKNALRITVNDALLTICAGALRRYLLEKNALPEEPLVAAVPISVRAPGDGGDGGNQVTVLTAKLPTHLEDPLSRAGAVSLSTSKLKKVHRAVPAKLLMDWMELPAPVLMAGVARIYENFINHDRLKPPFNLFISNVPGPQVPLFLAGAPLLANYPISIAYHGLALNITVLSYCEQLNVGLTACRAAVPDLEHLLDLLDQSLAELEAAAGLVPPPAAAPKPAAGRRARRPRRAAAGKLEKSVEKSGTMEPVAAK